MVCGEPGAVAKCASCEKPVHRGCCDPGFNLPSDQMACLTCGGQEGKHTLVQRTDPTVDVATERSGAVRVKQRNVVTWKGARSRIAQNVTLTLISP